MSLAGNLREQPRTPVREAFIKLASEELVAIPSNRGIKHLVALDLQQPAVTHLAALRRTKPHVVEIEKTQLLFEECAKLADPLATIITQRNLHSASGYDAGTDL